MGKLVLEQSAAQAKMKNTIGEILMDFIVKALDGHEKLILVSENNPGLIGSIEMIRSTPATLEGGYASIHRYQDCVLMEVKITLPSLIPLESWEYSLRKILWHKDGIYPMTDYRITDFQDQNNELRYDIQIGLMADILCRYQFLAPGEENERLRERA